MEMVIECNIYLFYVVLPLKQCDVYRLSIVMLVFQRVVEKQTVLSIWAATSSVQKLRSQGLPDWQNLMAGSGQLPQRKMGRRLIWVNLITTSRGDRNP